jgi:hypothetical protein
MALVSQNWKREKVIFGPFVSMLERVFVSMPVSSLPIEARFSFPVFALRFDFRFLSFPVSNLKV